MTREQVVAGLRPLLELPVERVLATHGGPFDRALINNVEVHSSLGGCAQHAVPFGSGSTHC